MQTNISAVWPFTTICATACDYLRRNHVDRVPDPPNLEMLQGMEATQPLYRTAGSAKSEPPLCYRVADYLIETLRKPFETSDSVCLVFSSIPFAPIAHPADSTRYNELRGTGSVSAKTSSRSNLALESRPKTLRGLDVDASN